MAPREKVPNRCIEDGRVWPSTWQDSSWEAVGTQKRDDELLQENPEDFLKEVSCEIQ